MDRHWMGVEWLPSQIQAVNPILIMLFIPLFLYVIYPALNSFFPLNSLKKMSLGFFLTVGAFLISAYIEQQIVAGFSPSISWQLLAFVVMTAAEVLVSITCLEFSYTRGSGQSKVLDHGFISPFGVSRKCVYVVGELFHPKTGWDRHVNRAAILLVFCRDHVCRFLSFFSRGENLSGANASSGSVRFPIMFLVKVFCGEKLTFRFGYG